MVDAYTYNKMRGDDHRVALVISSLLTFQKNLQLIARTHVLNFCSRSMSKIPIMIIYQIYCDVGQRTLKIIYKSRAITFSMKN
jgi:hypothetical protein